MAGLYIHIPYCRQACSYCDFHFSTGLQSKGSMVSAIIAELNLRKGFFGDSVALQTIYLGGGTPSLLSSAELEQLWEAIHHQFDVKEDAEITLEANPDDLTLAYLTFLKSLGINRLSIGIQSFLQEELTWMNRSHTSAQALRCIEDAQAVGFSALSIDLIFGTPYTDRNTWNQQVQQAVQLGVPHLSVYALTVEEKTPLHHWVNKDTVRLPADQVAKTQFLDAHVYLTSQGYDHYELSNYAFPGSYAKHNSAYWAGVPYLGVGPSAHSFNGTHRFSNLTNNAHYIRLLKEGTLPIQLTEELTPRDRYNEYIMTQLRTAKGISVAYLQQQFGKLIEEEFGSFLGKWEAEGFLVKKEDHWVLTPEGWWVSDGIIRELFK